MAFDLASYVSANEQTTPVEQEKTLNNVVDLKSYVTEYDTPKPSVYEDDDGIIETVGKGIVIEGRAAVDFVAALPEMVAGAIGTVLGTGLDYTIEKAQLWDIERKLKANPNATLKDRFELLEKEKNSTLKNSATRVNKAVREKAAYLNITKNADLLMDYLMTKKGKGEEWEEVKKSMANDLDGALINKAMNWIGENIHHAAESVEQETGLPSELGVAIAEIAMMKAPAVAKPVVRAGGKIAYEAGVSGMVRRITGTSDLAQLNKAIRKAEESGIKKDLKLLQEYKDTTLFHPITQRVQGYSFEGNIPKLVIEALQNPVLELSKKLRNVKTEEDFVNAVGLASNNLNKLDRTYTTLISRSLETKLTKLLGKDKQKQYGAYNNIIDHMTWDSTMKTPRPKLSKIERQLKKEVFDPAMIEYNRLIKKLHKNGKLKEDLIIDASKTGVVFPRQRMQSRQGFFKNVLGDYFKINDPYARRQPIKASTADRQYFSLYNKKTGERKLISLDQSVGLTQAKTGPTKAILEYVQKQDKTWRPILNKELTQLNAYKAKVEGKPLNKSGDKLGEYEVREATRKELMERTNAHFVGDAPAVLFNRIQELRQMERDLTFENSIKNSPYFKENAVKLKKGEATPEGFKKVQEDLTQNYRDLDGYVYKDRAAEILEDANRPRPDTILTKVSDALVKNMMLNPLPHMHNELIHFYSTKGFMRTWSPKARQQFKEDMMWATKEVQEFGPTYREALKNNSSMMSTNVKNTNQIDNIYRTNIDTWYSQPMKQNLKGGETNAQFFFRQADKAANRRVGETYAKVSNNAQNAMWSVRDVMFMMLLKQKQRQYPNLTMKEHIGLVESHLPSYRIPIRVGEKVLGAKMSRALSKTLQNQNLIIFARYKHGMISSGLNTIRDMSAGLDAPLRSMGSGGKAIADFIGARDIAKGRTVKEQMKDGFDSGLALASASMIIYPIMDAMFSEVFNNDHTHMRRAGILHVLDTANRVGEGSRDPYALFQNLATVNPTLLLGTELLLNTTFYNGRQIYNIDDPFQYQVADVLKKVGTAVPLASQIVHSQGDSSKVLGRQFDIKIPTDKQVKSEARQAKSKERARRKREAERAVENFKDQ